MNDDISHYGDENWDDLRTHGRRDGMLKGADGTTPRTLVSLILSVDLSITDLSSDAEPRIEQHNVIIANGEKMRAKS